MARAVARALRERKHLIAEAGTGVGKSFAYLVPAILFATEDQQDSELQPGDQPPPPASRRIVVSTHTISLQEQLISKDLPLLNSVIPREFSSVLVKGRGNYISLRRYETARLRATSLLNDVEFDQLQRMKDWLASTPDGSLSSLPFRPQGSLWDEVASDSNNCLGRRCPTYAKCFYYQARNRVQGAQILVVNHALFFSDLAVREAAGFGILPDYDAAILDECHTIENVASDHLGIKVTNGQVEYTLNKLYNPATGKGLLIVLELNRLAEKVHKAHYAIDQLAHELNEWMGQDNAVTARRVRSKLNIANPLSGMLSELSGTLSGMADQSEDASRRSELIGISSRLDAIAQQINSWLSLGDEGLVYWLERAFTRRDDIRTEMHAAPIDVSQRPSPAAVTYRHPSPARCRGSPRRAEPRSSRAWRPGSSQPT